MGLGTVLYTTSNPFILTHVFRPCISQNRKHWVRRKDSMWCRERSLCRSPSCRRHLSSPACRVACCPVQRFGSGPPVRVSSPLLQYGFPSGISALESSLSLWMSKGHYFVCSRKKIRGPRRDGLQGQRRPARHLETSFSPRNISPIDSPRHLWQGFV